MEQFFLKGRTCIDLGDITGDGSSSAYNSIEFLRGSKNDRIRIGRGADTEMKIERGQTNGQVDLFERISRCHSF